MGFNLGFLKYFSNLGFLKYFSTPDRRGDHTSCSLWLAVLAAGTHMAVFSIDGSLTASVSVSGRDPRVRPGAVDVLRLWQQRGYMLLYITERPDLQLEYYAQVQIRNGIFFSCCRHKNGTLEIII